MNPITSLTDSLYLAQPQAVDFDSVSLTTTLQRVTHGPAGVRGGFAVMLCALCKTHDACTWDTRSFHVLRLNQVIPCASTNAGLDDIKPSTLIYELLGTFHLSSDLQTPPSFSGDVGHLLAPEYYGVFLPSADILEIIVNGGVGPTHRICIGHLRQSETPHPPHSGLPVYLSMLDIRGKRSAMFGKTRLGKSNVVKLLVQGMLDVTVHDSSVGQLIFDVNGEYANDNPQDGASLASSYAQRCLVYFLSARNVGGHGKLLRFNLYERTEHAFEIIRELLPPHIAESDYVRTLLSCRLPALTRPPSISEEQAVRQLRKLMLFWTILDDAGFPFDEARLLQILTNLGFRTLFNPCFSQSLRLAAYQAVDSRSAPALPQTFREMTAEMAVIAKFALLYSNDPNLMRNGNFVFDLDELIMVRFLVPSTSDGTYVLRACLPFHSAQADNFIDEILNALHVGQTVIVDLGSANEQVIRYFAKTLSVAVFQAQEKKFVNNQLNNRYVQIYFEEAHMIFPPNSGNVIDVYSRFAKEGAKFNIGIVYSTQSPSTVNQDLLAQTENFFIGHLSSDRETATLASVQYAFKGREIDIMRARTPGYMRMLAYSNRYLIPLQARRYTGQQP